MTEIDWEIFGVWKCVSYHRGELCVMSMLRVTLLCILSRYMVYDIILLRQIDYSCAVWYQSSKLYNCVEL